MALDDIYKEVILDHYKNPRNKREMPDADRRGVPRARSRANG